MTVPAMAGIPVTHRHVSTHFTVLTGMSAKSHQEALEQTWERAAALGGTLVFLMGVRALPRIVSALLRGGLTADVPVAMVERGTRQDQRVTRGSLGSIVQLSQQRGVKSPAVIVVGDVVSLQDDLGLARLCDVQEPMLAARTAV